MPRPDRVVFVVGTGTSVGKTWVAAALVARLRSRDLRVAARKPAQSFTPGEVTDAEVLAQATGEAPADVCPRHRWYERPMAPPMAAAVLRRPGFTIADLAGELAWPNPADVGLVEGVGGVRSPLADDGDTVDLLGAVGADLVVLVAGAGLGTLNLIRLCGDVLARWPVVVYLNRYDPADDLHRGNRQWLAARAGPAVVTSIDGLDRLADAPQLGKELHDR
jgi:dethiobiotin synthetase